MDIGQPSEGTNFLKSKLRSFHHCTLQDNWYEDRLQAAEDVSHEERLEKSKSRNKDDSIGMFVGFANVSQVRVTTT